MRSNPRTNALFAAVSVVATALAIGSAAVVSPTPAFADVDDYEFDSFHSAIELGVDGQRRATASITETIVAVFPDFDQNRGIVRAIPLSDQGYDLDVEIVSVTDGDGEPVAWERDDDDGFAVLALGTDEYVQGTTTYVIEYTLRDVIRHFDDSGGDEFTWDINGDGWAQPFREVSTDVIVSPELAESLAGEYVCYAGLDDIREPCAIEKTDSTFVASAGPLDPFRTLTVSIGFDGNTVVQPQRAQDSWVVSMLPWALLGLALAVLIVAVVLRAVRWRDPAARRAIIAEFSPPEPLDLLLDGEVVRRSGQVFAAVVVELAIRGVVRIVDLDPAAQPDARYGIELVDHSIASDTELDVLNALFDGELSIGAVVQPSEISSNVAVAVHGRLKRAAFDATERGLRARPSALWSTGLRIASAVVLFSFGIPLVWTIIGDRFIVPWVFVLALVATAITIATWAVTSVPLVLTVAGADRRDHLLGLREYLTVAEQERFRMLQSPDGAERFTAVLGADASPTDAASIVKLNERLLPWAVLWGVEDEWSTVLVAGAAAAGVTSGVVAMGLANTQVLSWASLSSTRMAPVAASTSSWSSSGGSSFSSSSFGGGFAGGGGGGGGGGGR